MNWEIEIKAHVDDPVEIEKRILSLGARPIRAYQKVDQYYEIPEKSGEVGDGVKDFRLRIDGDKALVTFKDKKRKEGLEMNREGEFTVSDPEMFKVFVSRIGARPRIEKRKRGKAYRLRDLLLELSEVTGLGFFVEIEAIFQSDHELKDPSFIDATELRLFQVLDTLGIPRDRVEARPYTLMLSELKT
ncbi:MAG: class IV adenylate cyclase [Spirochaetales bacterium]|nr:class IV adenylate cyclase [Spirochaetales bacterium]